MRAVSPLDPVPAFPVEEVDKLDAGSWFDAKFAGEPVPRLEPYLDPELRGEHADRVAPVGDRHDQQGAVAGPVAAEGTFHVVRVESVERTAGRPLEAVQAEIAAQLRERKTADALNALVRVFRLER